MIFGGTSMVPSLAPSKNKPLSVESYGYDLNSMMSQPNAPLTNDSPSPLSPPSSLKTPGIESNQNESIPKSYEVSSKVAPNIPSDAEIDAYNKSEFSMSLPIVITIVVVLILVVLLLLQLTPYALFNIKSKFIEHWYTAEPDIYMPGYKNLPTYYDY